MDPVSIVFILNGLVNLALQISENFTPTTDTPEEELAKFNAIVARLRDVTAAVAAWIPIPEDPK